MTSRSTRFVGTVAICFNLIVGSAGVAWLGLRPIDGAPVAVFFPPGLSSADRVAAVARADARILGMTLDDLAIVVAGGGRPMFDRLEAAGAVLIVNAQPFSGCAGNAKQG